MLRRVGRLAVVKIPILLGCTRVGDTWCPVHGGCTCPDNDPGCVLHGERTDHAERGAADTPATVSRYWRVLYDSPGSKDHVSSALLRPETVHAHLQWLAEFGHATNIRVEETVLTLATRGVPVAAFEQQP